MKVDAGDKWGIAKITAAHEQLRKNGEGKTNVFSSVCEKAIKIVHLYFLTLGLQYHSGIYFGLK